MRMNKEIIFHPGGAVPWPRAVKAGNMIHFAAAGVDKLGNVAGKQFEQQLEFTLKELKATLESLGSSMADILHLTWYYVDLSRDLEKAPAIRRKYIPDDKVPMMAAIGVTELAPVGDWPLLIEVTGCAMIPGPDIEQSPDNQPEVDPS